MDDEKINRLESWWSRKCGIKEVLLVALPLIISTASWSLTNFIDRMFLLWHSAEAMAAALPSGMLHFTMICFPIGVASYLNTFVAQYHGAKQEKKIGLVLMQGIKLCFLSIPIFLASIPIAHFLFEATTKETNLIGLQTLYFSVLAFGAGGSVMAAALSSFFIGQERNSTVMIVDTSSCFVNLIFDWILIFGHLGFPEMGIEGAAWATVMSQWFKVIVYGVLIFRPANFLKYGFTASNAWDFLMIKRLFRFGSPNGLQLLLEVAAFTMFLLLMANLGSEAMTVTTLAFSINGFAFVPLIGMGIAVSTLVGREIGSGNPDKAVTATWSGITISLIYTGVMGCFYLFTPELFLMAHQSGMNPEEFNSLKAVTIILLRFVAAYCVFDALNMIFVSALKGAGDVTFIMIATCVVSALLLGVGWVGLTYFNFGLYECWSVITIWIFILGMVYLIRFLEGSWKKMKVIEPELI